MAGLEFQEGKALPLELEGVTRCPLTPSGAVVTAVSMLIIIFM